MLIGRLPEIVRASNNGRNRQVKKVLDESVLDIHLLGIVHYNFSPQQALNRLARQAHDLTPPIYSALWETVKVLCIHPAQLRQCCMLRGLCLPCLSLLEPTVLNLVQSKDFPA